MNSKVFEKPKPLIGILQLMPLPGSPGWKGRIDQVIARAEQEATALATGGIDAILVENTFDTPYTPDRIDPAGAIAMGLVIRRIMHFTHLPIGVHILRNDAETALAVAMNVGAKFIRVGLLTGAGVCETGIIKGKNRELSAYRKLLQAEGISVFADVSLQKILPLVSPQTETDVSLKTLIHQTLETGDVDGVVLTDTNLAPEEIQILRKETEIPVFYDFHGDLPQVPAYLQAADGLMLSNSIKKSAINSPFTGSTVDLTKVEELIALSESCRQQLMPV